MTVTGIAMIAAGLATLVCFWKALCAGTPRRRGPRPTKRRAGRTGAIEAARRLELASGPAHHRQSLTAAEPGVRVPTRVARDGSAVRAVALLPAQAGSPDISGGHLTSAAYDSGLVEVQTPHDARRRRRRGRTGTGRTGITGTSAERDDDERSGLASIGLADEESPEPEHRDVERHDARDPEHGYSARSEGHRGDDVPSDAGDATDDHPSTSDDPPSDVDVVDRGVRLRYRTEPDMPTGNYWMPVPETAYANLHDPRYGWPRSDGDPVGESEPTAVVPLWPPARPSDRIELPRTWSYDSHVDRDAVERWLRADRDGRAGWGGGNNPAEHAEPRQRPRPRPNPAAEMRSTVYVSRHAAEQS
jgi:hypothetical protein